MSMDVLIHFHEKYCLIIFTDAQVNCATIWWGKHNGDATSADSVDQSERAISKERFQNRNKRPRCIKVSNGPLKLAKNVRETFFRGLELIRVKLMWSRETWRHNDIKSELCLNVCFLLQSFCVAGIEKMSNFLKILTDEKCYVTYVA